MNGDHASDQLKTARLGQGWKEEVTRTDLGNTVINSMSLGALSTALVPHMSDYSESSNVPEALGNAIKALAMELGTASFEGLPADEQRRIDFFVRGGCCMHKDLNSVKGGNDAMQAQWAELDTLPPVLLANKANAAAIRADTTGETLGAAAQLATDASTRGAVKAASIAGALFNNKDDKKGHQDFHRHYFEKVKLELTGEKHSVKFPDTSNTRYQCYCNAAAELLTYLPHYITFLELIRDKKDKPGFNHMEQNLYNALHDSPTLTEFAVLVLYAQSVTHPYMREVRGPGSENVNLLDLGPLHDELHNHIARIIDDPSILIGANVSYESATLDGLPWEDSRAVSAVYAMADRLPFLKPTLVAFFAGALETWERFSAEFAGGGLVDSLTASERTMAFMPSTNDANEGSLGQWRRHARLNPNTTINHFSGIAAYHRNDTQAFMDAKFQAEDHTLIIRTARKIDANGSSKTFRKELIQSQQRLADNRREKDQERQQKAQDKFDKLATINVITDRTKIASLKCSELDEQLEIHRCIRHDKDVPIKARVAQKAKKLEALLAAVGRYEVYVIHLVFSYWLCSSWLMFF